jgi:HPt (histidine-containing phosphotransfer) domain-containing protein
MLDRCLPPSVLDGLLEEIDQLLAEAVRHALEDDHALAGGAVIRALTRLAELRVRAAAMARETAAWPASSLN